MLDVEISGIDPGKGHRIIRIAAFEIVDRVVTGHCFQRDCDPEHTPSPEVIAVTGFAQEFSIGKPQFGEIVTALMLFIGDAPLIVHNAPFNLAFLDAELERLGRKPVFRTWPRVIDTLRMARAKGLRPTTLRRVCAHYGSLYDRDPGGPGIEMVEAVAHMYLAMTSNAA